ncbi:MAG: branched-chain amino acid dehydrogenase [Acidimicrobiia bacterium]|nr:MAG: branched-chain amino acid dehydrogenase [Acidimicrobiia bacterium]
MGVFETIGTETHESVHFGIDHQSGLRAIVAIHSTVLGPSLGGTRFYPYPDEQAALVDVLRLSKGMTYKAAAAGLAQGGGKAVIIGDPEQLASEDLFRAYGRFVDGLSGRYVTAEDVGTTVANMEIVATRTSFVSGLAIENGGSGDPSPATARGVVASIRAASDHLWGTNDLHGRRVAIKGVGKVGYALAEMLADDGAELVVADVNDNATDMAAREFGAKVVAVDEIHKANCDVYAPCALGADLSETTIPHLACAAVVGSANNQLAEARDADRLAERGILYAPDFVVNAGGIINIAAETGGYSIEKSDRMVDNIYNNLTVILKTADQLGISTEAAAEHVAETRIEAARKQGDES